MRSWPDFLKNMSGALHNRRAFSPRFLAQFTNPGFCQPGVRRLVRSGKPGAAPQGPASSNEYNQHGCS
jgi:hypothetical protein